jgi:hypothetical protein
MADSWGFCSEKIFILLKIWQKMQAMDVEEAVLLKLFCPDLDF